jgi:HlyD family secretion protein
MQVDTNVAEADVGRVKVGHPATFTVDAFPGRTFRGEVQSEGGAGAAERRDLRRGGQRAQQRSGLAADDDGQRPDRDRPEGRCAEVPNAALRFRPPGSKPSARAAEVAREGQVAVAAPVVAGPGGREGGLGQRHARSRLGRRCRQAEGRPDPAWHQRWTTTEVTSGDLSSSSRFSWAWAVTGRRRRVPPVGHA